VSTNRSGGPGRGSRFARGRPGVTLGVVLLVAVLAGTTPAEGRDALRAPRRVRIVGFAFSPHVITIARGTRVRWTNADSVPHTATSNKGAWSSGTLLTGQSFVRIFRRVGTFWYHCAIHPSMHGTVRVT
jgi:plastocyanin